MSMNPNKVIIPCRFSYLHCWEPDSVNGGDPKYSVSAIIPKGDTKTIEKIRAAVENVKKESLSKWGGKIPPNLKLPLRDGDIERPDDEAYAGMLLPQLQTARQKPRRWWTGRCSAILDQSEVYSGCCGQHLGDLLRLQHQRQPRHRGGAGQHPEAPRRRAAGRQGQR